MPGDLFSQALALGLLGIAVALAATSLWVLTTRRRLRSELDALRHEMRVSNGAAYNVGESVAQLREAVAALESEEPDRDADAPLGDVFMPGELSASEAHLLDRLRESRVH